MIRDWFRRRSAKDASWVRCPHCAEILDAGAVRRQNRVCPACGYHHPLPLGERIALLFDEGGFSEEDGSLASSDPLRWKLGRGYSDVLAAARKSSGEKEALITGRGRLDGRSIEVALSEPRFLSGSLGAASGERLCRAFDRAAETRRPFLLFASGGTLRHAEGLMAGVQLGRLADHRAALYAASAPFVAVLGPPLPTGGLLSLATSADVVLAEPLPAQVGDPTGGAQSPGLGGIPLQGSATGTGALVAAGLVDEVVPRASLRAHIARILALLAPR